MEDNEYITVPALVDEINAIQAAHGRRAIQRQRIHYRLKRLGIQRFRSYSDSHTWLIRRSDAEQLLAEARQGIVPIE